MIRRLIRFIRSFFSFSYAEAKGFLAMAGGIAVAAVIYLFYNSLPAEGYSSFSQDQARLDSLVSLIEAREMMKAEPKESLDKERGFRSSRRRGIVHFHFNPNKLSADSLQLLGIPKWLAERMLKYRLKGGVFRTKEDLLKIYGFTDSLFLRLKPYILIPPVSTVTRRKESAENKQTNEGKLKDYGAGLSLDLNRADSLQLQQLKGIGPVLSSRIVRFRNKIGGFVNPAQLYEVYGMDSSLVKELIKVMYIEPAYQPKKIGINTASREELKAHPYISPAQAGLIDRYKKQHGPFTSESDLLRIHTFDSKFVGKIAPYIRFD